MKIDSIDIKAFGGLKNYKLNFAPDFQVILGENEAGKTTIQQFIRAMFYGFSRSGHSVETNSRKKYQPWSGQTMSGSIFFDYQGLSYRLIRTFGQRKSEDQIRLFLEGSGQEIILKNKDQPALELFGISEAEFVNTVFIEETDLDTGQLQSLDSKLNRKVGLAEYDWSYEEILQRLNKAKRYLKPDRSKAGRIDQLLEKKQELTHELAELLERDRLLASMGDRREELELQLQELDSRQKYLELEQEQHKKLDLAGAYERYKKLAEELEKVSEDRPAGLKTSSVTVQDLTEMAKQRQQLAYARTEYEIKENLLKKRLADQEAYQDRVKQRKSEILQERSRLQYLQKQNLDRQPSAYRRQGIPYAAFVPLTLAETFCLIGGLLLRKNAPSWSVFLIVMAVLLPFIMVLVYFAWQKRQERSFRQYQQAVRKHDMRKLKIKNDLDNLEWDLNSLEQGGANFQTDLAYLEEEVEKAKKLFDREQNKLKYLVQPYFTNLPDDDQLDLAIRSLREQTVENVQSEERAKQIQKEMTDLLEGMSPDEFYQAYLDAQDWLSRYQTELRTFPEFSEHHITTQLQGITEARIKAREELAAVKTKLDHYQTSDQNTYELDKQLRDTEESLARAEFNYASILVALQLLDHSKKTFDQEIRPQVNTKASHYLAAMTAEGHNELKIDQDYLVRLAETDQGFKDQSYYSAGLNDQVNLALRLALTDLLQDQAECLPLILDDPLIQLDKGRAKQTLNLLQNLGQNQKRQVLLFTSQHSIYELLDQAEGKIRELK